MKRIVPILLATTLMAACNTPEKISYFQNVPLNTYETIGTDNDIRLRPQDQISIIVTTKDAEITSLFNLSRSQYRAGETELRPNYQGEVSGYTLDSKGEIDFPIIGKIKIGGLTRSEVAQKIKNSIIEAKMVKDLVVTVEGVVHTGLCYLLYFSAVGEVKKPGKYAITRDRISLLEGLAMAGDLNILGRRDAIYVIREENGQRVSHEVDIRKKELFDSPVYYLRQNDVIYVVPNNVRAGQSTLNDNTFLSTSFFLRSGSFLTSLGYLLFK